MFKNKIIKVRPGLLPDFRGDACKEEFESGAKESGCTIHYVDYGLCSGDVILQKKVTRLEEDDFNAFKDRVHEMECKAIQSYVESVVV